MPPPTVSVKLRGETHDRGQASFPDWSNRSNSGAMRRTVAASILLASLLGIGTAGAAECPADALGVSRTLVVDVNEHPRVGSWQYG